LDNPILPESGRTAAQLSTTAGTSSEWLGFGGIEFNNGVWKSRPKNEPYKGAFDWHDAEVVQHVRKLQPDIVINDRTDAPADFRSREGDRALGPFENQFPWELCTTITEGAWGYEPNVKVKSFAQLIHLLVGAAGRDGNFLLNVSPKPDGEIPAGQAERVREIGSWLRENGESIYGTRGGPWLPGSYGVSTHNGSAVYIHVLQAPRDSTLSLPSLRIRVRSVSLLNGPELQFEESGPLLTIHIPAASTQSVDTIIKLELQKPWNTSAVVPVPGA
jgi:alpha-L-fucosidase